MTTSFLTPSELAGIGFKACGDNVLISRRASIYAPHNIGLGHHVRIDDFCILSGGDFIRLGNYIHIAAYSAIYGGGGVEMGDFSGLSSRVIVYSESDDYTGRSLTNPMVPRKYKPNILSAPVIIGRHCIVGTGSTILPGVNVGEGTAIGAHSLVMKDCEEWKVLFGSPAKVIRNRRRDLLQLEAQFLAENS